MRLKFLAVIVSVLAILGVRYVESWRIHAADYPLPRVRLSAATGPLLVNPANPRYLTDGNGKAVFLAGSNYWDLFQDGGRTNPPPAFDFDAFIRFAVEHGYNYMKPRMGASLAPILWRQLIYATDNIQAHWAGERFGR